MSQKARKTRAFFEVGHKVQLYPKSETLGAFWVGQYATIKRIEQKPDPNFFEDPKDWYNGPHWTLFWVELDEHSELNEVPFRFQELQKLPSKMNKQQATAYCKQRISTERDEDRRDAYLSLTHYLNGEWAGSLVGPLSHFTNPQDIINVLITWSSEIRKRIVMIRENNNALDFANKYEVQAQVYDELLELLMTTSKTALQRV